MKNKTRGRVTPITLGMGLAFLLASCLTSHAQRQGKSPGDRVDKVFKDAGIDKTTPGCAVAVIQKGRIVYEHGYGKADRDRGIDITPTTVFHAASLAKQFTAMSIMLLVKRGKLKLEDPVDKHIAVPIAVRPDGTHMTIGDMLRHISGIRDQWILVTLAGQHLYEDVVTEEDVLRLVSQMESPDFEPRTDILYSNTGYTLAGRIVEKISGKSLSEFAHEHIFRPLGMTHTKIIKKHDEVVENRAYGYSQKPFQLWMPMLDVTGPTNLVTTVGDLARWNRNFDDKTVGGDAVLSQMQMPALLSNRRPARLGMDDDGNVIHYGLGLMLTTYRERRVVEHDGRDAGYRAHLIRFPDLDFAVACLCNESLPEEKLPGKFARQIADIYLDRRLGPAPRPNPQHPARPHTPPTQHPPIDLTQFTGEYYSKEIDATYHVEQQDSSLVIKRRNYGDTRLKPATPASVAARLFGIEEFAHARAQPITDGTVQFEPHRGKITGFSLTGLRFKLRRIDNFPFQKRP